MKKYLFPVFVLFSLNTMAQSVTALNITYMQSAYLRAASAMEDTLAVGGFGPSNNSPQELNESMNFAETGLFLKLDPLSPSTFAKKYKGYTLYLVNKSDSTIVFDASDSRLDGIAEVFVNNKWQAIEYNAESWCGNSYHRVFLKPNQYWSFAVPQYQGQVKTKLRYKVRVGKNDYIYSNEIDASINKGQLKKKNEATEMY